MNRKPIFIIFLKFAENYHNLKMFISKQLSGKSVRPENQNSEVSLCYHRKHHKLDPTSCNHKWNRTVNPSICMI